MHIGILRHLLPRQTKAEDGDPVAERAQTINNRLVGNFKTGGGISIRDNGGNESEVF